MAKTYLSAVKYNIVAEFQIEGIVDKPDIIGAVFGQSEGLLGQEMDLKQLQQNGKIGRIEIESKVVNGQTQGTINVPSSMDMVQTSLLAAAIESVDKVGPCEAKIEIKKIEDTRGQKRKVISNRAQELLQQFMKEEIPESQEMADQVMKGVRTAKIQAYGREKLPAGPDIDSSNEIMVVEGRADVLNLLKHGITNVIGMEGSTIPQTIIDLSRNKTITAFVDGDRGGELNARHLQEVARLDFVIRAPDGKEVEELTQKEIVMALRKKMAPEEAFSNKRFGGEFQRPEFSENRFEHREFGGRKPFGKPRFGGPPRRSSFGERRPMSGGGMGRGNMRGSGNPRGRGGFSSGRGMGRGRPRFGPSFSAMGENPPEPEFGFEAEASRPEPAQALTPEESQALAPIMKELQGSLKARLFDSSMNPLGESNVRELIQKIKETPNTATVVFDGIITKRLAEEAENLGIQRLVGIKKGWFKTEGAIKLLTISG